MDTEKDANSDQNKSVNQGENSLEKPKQTERHLVSEISSSLSFSYAYKKTERIAAATYLVSDTLYNSEPLRLQLRENVLSLLSLVSGLRPTAGQEREALLEQINGYILRLASLFEIGRFSGSISEMNAAVLTRELRALRQYLSSHSMSDERSRISADSFWAVGPSEPSQSSLAGTLASGYYPPASVVPTAPTRPDPVVSGPSEPAGAAQSSVAQAKPFGKANSRKKTRKKGRVTDQEAAVNKQERRTIIFSLIRKQGEITVRDVASVVSNCSQKTLQRELLALVDEGVLQKEGERRWSKYSFST